MNKTKERKISKTKNWQTLALVISVFAVMVIVGVVAFLRFYDSYIDGVLYRERLSQMQEVTAQLFKGIEDVVQNQWDNTDTFCNYVELGKPQDTENLLKFMSKQAKLNGLQDKNSKLVAVDELGRYLTQDGWQGTLEEMELLLGNPEKVSFVSKSMTSGETYMYFLKRLEEPITMQDGDRTVNLIYYGEAQNMTELNAYFTCDAYDDNNSVYVLDKQGSRLFRNGSRSLLRGYNAYTTLEQMEYLHDNSFDEAKRELDSVGCGYANAVLDGEEYYYALYQMEYAEWTLLFLVPSSYVATDVVSMVRTTVKMILAFAVVLLVLASFVIIMLMQFKQKQVVEAERRNSEVLAKANKELTAAAEAAERAEKTAKSANKAKSDFLSNMSHDIRTPMNAIVGMTKLIEHEKNDPDKLDIYLEKIQISSQHLLSLINDVLDMSKIESGDVSLDLDPVRLADEVTQIENIVRPQAEEHGHSFTVRVRKLSHEYVICDAVRMRQVMINLLSNAVKYTHNGGTIFYDIEELPCDAAENAKFRFTVTDNGCGMTQEFIKRIYEPFVRAENSTTNKVQGTGLGMAITKSIVDMMGGSIDIQSELGKGSRFDVTLTFPIDQNAEQSIDAKSVLLVSDDETLVENIRASLGSQEILLRTAAYIPEAVSLIGEMNADVILLNGYSDAQKLSEAVKTLREHTKEKTLIFCCDYAVPEQVIGELKKNGADGLVTRPFFFSKLVRAVNEKNDSSEISESENNSILNGMKFLCAEDNELNAEILTALLEIAGAKCVIYPDGEEIVKAFANVKKGDFDAILMDVQMPKMNGFEATKAIRNGENPLGKTIPIIAMTANAFSSDVQDCLNAGMDAHIPKPLDLTALEKNIRDIVTPPPRFASQGQMYSNERHNAR